MIPSRRLGAYGLLLAVVPALPLSVPCLRPHVRCNHQRGGGGPSLPWRCRRRRRSRCRRRKNRRRWPPLSQRRPRCRCSPARRAARRDRAPALAPVPPRAPRRRPRWELPAPHAPRAVPHSRRVGKRKPRAPTVRALYVWIEIADGGSAWLPSGKRRHCVASCVAVPNATIVSLEKFAKSDRRWNERSAEGKGRTVFSHHSAPVVLTFPHPLLWY